MNGFRITFHCIVETTPTTIDRLSLMNSMLTLGLGHRMSLTIFYFKKTAVLSYFGQRSSETKNWSRKWHGKQRCIPSYMTHRNGPGIGNKTRTDGRQVKIVCQPRGDVKVYGVRHISFYWTDYNKELACKIANIKRVTDSRFAIQSLLGRPLPGSRSLLKITVNSHSKATYLFILVFK